IAPSGLSAAAEAEARRGTLPGLDVPREAAGGIPMSGSAEGQFLPIETPTVRGLKSARLGELDFDVHTRGQIELHQRIDRLSVRLHDVQQPLVSAHLELLPRLLVDMRTAVHGELLNTRRQGNGAPKIGRAAGRERVEISAV